jgi:hypothetical protein
MSSTLAVSVGHNLATVRVDTCYCTPSGVDGTRRLKSRASRRSSLDQLIYQETKPRAYATPPPPTGYGWIGDVRVTDRALTSEHFLPDGHY